MFFPDSDSHLCFLCSMFGTGVTILPDLRRSDPDRSNQMLLWEMRIVMKTVNYFEIQLLTQLNCLPYISLTFSKDWIGYFFIEKCTNFTKENKQMVLKVDIKISPEQVIVLFAMQISFCNNYSIKMVMMNKHWI